VPVIEAISHRRDTLALLPTGGGKSICFQIPGLLLGGLTLVVSPLIALMKDQVEQLKRRDISALFLHAGMSWQQQRLEMENALKGHYRFLYVAPERLASASFREYLPNLNLSLLVVDEAHCLSMWGRDFRPSYCRIHELRSELGLKVPVAAFTASAPEWIQNDIISGLALDSPVVVNGNFFRPNLRFKALETENRWDQLLSELRELGYPQRQETAIVFASSRKEVQEAALFLREKGYPAEFYHAGLTHAQRSERQRLFMKGSVPIMVCTNAFGMGVDKPNVRLVFHLSPPSSPEDYYQEAGRAGRDGQAAVCAMVFSASDFDYRSQLLHRQFPEIKELRRLYNAVLNSAGIMPGSGLDSQIPLNLEALCQRYKLPAYESHFGIKALESLGVWSLMESGVWGSRLSMKYKADEVYEFKVTHAEYENTLDALMRNLPGLFHGEQVVSESNLCKRAACSESEFRNQLMALHNIGVIEYHPSQGEQHLWLLEERHSHPDWDVKPLEELKKRRLLALKEMHRYGDWGSCRAQYWNDYFQSNSPSFLACGVCDNCLQSGAVDAWSEFCQWVNGGGLSRLELLRKMPKTDPGLLEAWMKIGMEEGWLMETREEGLFLVQGRKAPEQAPQ
jgi:ATP-dependent DNA helicase RecQ